MVGICETWTRPFLGVVSFSLLGNPPDRSGSSFDTPQHGCHLAPGSPRHLLFFDTFFCCALFGRALVCVAGCGQLWKAVVLPPSSGVGREEKTAQCSVLPPSTTSTLCSAGFFLTKSAFLWGKLWKNWNCAVIFCHGRVLKGEITSPIYLSPTQAVQGDNPIVKK